VKRTPKAADVDIRFSAWPPVTLEFINDFGNSIQFLGGPVGTGKCFAPGTRVLMFDGTVRAVETIGIGEQLMGPDGLPREVYALASGVSPMYRVTQDTGESYEVNEGHPLVLLNPMGEVVHVPVEDFGGRWAEHLKGFRARRIEGAGVLPDGPSPAEIDRLAWQAFMLGDGESLIPALKCGDDTRIKVLGATIACSFVLHKSPPGHVHHEDLGYLSVVARLARFMGFDVGPAYKVGDRHGIFVHGSVSVIQYTGCDSLTRVSDLREIGVEVLGRGEYYGFTIGNPLAHQPHHFLLEDLTVVHNTYAAAAKLLMMALHIKPREDGWRRSRWIVARRTYGDLEASVVKDFEESVAKGMFFSSGKTSPMFGRIYLDTPDLKVDAEVYFYAFENDESAKKIKSLKFTGGMLVEAQEFESHLTIRRIYERLGRYPVPRDVDELEDDQLDTNPEIEFQFPTGHYRGRFLFGDINYTGMGWMYDYLVTNNKARGNGKTPRVLYRQPSVYEFVQGGKTIDVPDRTAIEGLYKGEEGVWVRNQEALPYIKFNGWQYWADILTENYGDDGEVTRNVLGKFYRGTGGKPVHPKFREEIHVAGRDLKYTPGIHVVVGVDNGFNNAWIYMQMVGDMVYVIDEITNVGEHAKSIKDAVQDDILPYNNLHLHGWRIKYVLDQSFFTKEGGEGKAQVEQLTESGLSVMPCPQKFTTAIRSVVGDVFRKRQVLVSPKCQMLIQGLSGGYSYPFMPSTGQHSETPDKRSVYSHIVEAFEFGVVSYFVNPFDRLQKGKGDRKKARKKYNYLVD
jgi:hypothetical protein